MVIAAATGEIVLGVISLLILLGLLYLGFRVVVIALRLLWRLVTWPVRALRGSPPTGAGADYEAMIRQQPRTSPATGERRLPFPPPEGWQPESAVSQVVLPPPGYRTREPDAKEPEPIPVVREPAMVMPDSTPKPSAWTRLMRTPVRIPAWVTMSFAWLGVFFLVAKPLGLTDWIGYGIALIFAVGIGLYTKAHYHSKILWRSGKNIVLWVRWERGGSAPPPIVIEAGGVADGEPASLVLRDADKLDHLLQQRLITRDEYERLRASGADGSPPAAP